MNLALKTPQVSPAARPLPGSCTDTPRASLWPQEVRAATPVPGVWQRQDLGTDACRVDVGGSLEGAKWLGRARALSNRERRADRGPGRWGEVVPPARCIPESPLSRCWRRALPHTAKPCAQHRRLTPAPTAGSLICRGQVRGWAAWRPHHRTRGWAAPSCSHPRLQRWSQSQLAEWR